MSVLRLRLQSFLVSVILEGNRNCKDKNCMMEK